MKADVGWDTSLAQMDIAYDHTGSVMELQIVVMGLMREPYARTASAQTNNSNVYRNSVYTRIGDVMEIPTAWISPMNLTVPTPTRHAQISSLHAAVQDHVSPPSGDVTYRGIA